jgi:hypothetical protein
LSIGLKQRVVHRPVIEAACPSRLTDEIDAQNGHQHHQGAKQGVEEKLHRRFAPPLRTPHPDEDVHRDEHRLEEDVEEDEVQRDQRPQHRRLDEKEGDVEFLHPFMDEFPGRQHHHRPQKAGQQHQGDTQPVDAHVVADAKLGTPRPAHLQLELRALRVEEAVGQRCQAQVEQHREEGPGPHLASFLAGQKNQ